MLEKVAEKIKGAGKLVVLTGAGISKESGIPTFRGPDGLWKKYRPEELATPWAFQKNPELVWEWYNWRRSLMADKKPNPGHLFIAHLERIIPDFWLITQNIDGLHQLAGSKRIIELHGNIWRERCTNCPYKRTVPRKREYEEKLPKCPECGSLLRPDVVWFGETLPEDALNAAIKHSETCDVMLVVGTSAVVQPAASLPVIAKNSGAFVIEVNPEETPISHLCDITVRMGAGQFAEAMKEHIKWQP